MGVRLIHYTVLKFDTFFIVCVLYSRNRVFGPLDAREKSKTIIGEKHIRMVEGGNPVAKSPISTAVILFVLIDSWLVDKEKGDRIW